MPLIEINDLDRFGVIKDVVPYMMPPEAFSQGLNVRIQDGGIERLEGKAQVFGTPPIAPHFAIAIASTSQVYWLYVDLTKAYVYDGSAHTNITRQTAGVDVNYTAAVTREWNGCLLGGVPLLNNGTDLPQYWPLLDITVNLANLANWPTTARTKILRSYGPYLVALNVTKSSVNYPHMVKWSHPADPGGIPISWDETDPTKDAGEYDLPDAHAGVIVEGGGLRDHFFVFKEGSVWRMAITGSSAIFDFEVFLETTGILTQRCVAYTSDGMRQVFASQDDILVHNGNTAESILDRRMRRYLFNQISTSGYRNCFMFTNPFKDEVWFCYPENGFTNPNKALIWNYREGEKGAITEADIDFRNAAPGTIEGAAADTWDSVSGTWDTYVGAWSIAARRKVLCCATDSTKFLQLDVGATNDGALFSALLQREGLSVEGRKRGGDWIVDFTSQKLVTRVYFKIEGGPVLIRLGFQDLVDGPVTWSTEQSFDPATQMWLDFAGTGKAIAIQFASTASVPWKLLGYKLEMAMVSRF